MTADRLLITGATGFVGTWMLRHWRKTHPNIEIWATSHQPDNPENRADHFAVLDLKDRDAVNNFVRRSQPTQVIHLAGLVANASLEEYLAVNVVGTEHLYQAIAGLANAKDIPIVQAGTAALYGPIFPNELPITEENQFRPLTPYALSKTTQDHLSAQYWRTHELKTIRARIFNLLGPGQPKHLVPAAFLKQLANLRPGETLRVGNLTTRRDFVDVRDVARAFDGLIQVGQPGKAYNIGSGTSVPIRDLLNELISLSGIHDVVIEENSTLRRKVDVPDVCADITAIKRDIGWSPKMTLQESLQTMLEATKKDEQQLV